MNLLTTVNLPNSTRKPLGLLEPAGNKKNLRQLYAPSSTAKMAIDPPPHPPHPHYCAPCGRKTTGARMTQSSLVLRANFCASMTAFLETSAVSLIVLFNNSMIESIVSWIAWPNKVFSEFKFEFWFFPPFVFPLSSSHSFKFNHSDAGLSYIFTLLISRWVLASPWESLSVGL